MKFTAAFTSLLVLLPVFALATPLVRILSHLDISTSRLIPYLHTGLPERYPQACSQGPCFPR